MLVPYTADHILEISRVATAYRARVDLRGGYFLTSDYNFAQSLVEHHPITPKTPPGWRLSEAGKNHLHKHPSGIIVVHDAKIQVTAMYLLNPKDTLLEVTAASNTTQINFSIKPQ